MPPNIVSLLSPSNGPSSAEPEAGFVDLLASVAQLVSETVGFDTVAIDVYRPAWDDFELLVVHGSAEARDALLGRTRERVFLECLLDERFARRGAYFVPRERRPPARLSYVPRLQVRSGSDAWHSEDALLVPLRRSDGHLLGVLSLDEPVSGARPTDAQLDLLVALAAQGAWAIEAAQQATSAERKGAALAQLMGVSAKLAANASPTSVLQAVCDAICDTLGFDLTVVQLADHVADRYQPRTATGIEVGSELVVLDVPIATFDRVFDPDFDVEGCYLLSPKQARARVRTEPTSFQSTSNGFGRLAWSGHWLLIPLRNGAGERIGFIWVDNPRDRLLPSRPMLQALRLFADQAEAALVTAERVQALHEVSEERRALIDASPLGIVHLGVDRHVSSWNPAARRMLGYTDEEVLGQEPPWIAEHERPDFRRRFDEQFTHDLHHAIYRDLRADGSFIETATASAPIRDRDGTVTGMIALLSDITEQEEAKRELARREAEMRAMLESSPVALMLLDRDGLVQWWSPAGERIFGWTADDAIGHTPPLVPEHAMLEFEQGMAIVLAGESIVGAERSRVCKDGSSVQVRLSASPVLAADGSIDGVMAALEDVTEAKQAADDLVARQAELEALHETALALVGELAVEEVLDQIVANAARLIKATGAFVLLVDEAERLVPVIHWGNSAHDVGGPVLARGEGIAGKVWAERRAFRADGIASSKPGLPQPDAGIGPLACVPLMRDDEVLGVLGVNQHEDGPSFSDADLSLLARFAPLASLALRNARLHEAARREIAERRAAESGLQREKDYSERLIQAANALIIGLDQEGRVEVFNEEAERITGYTRSEMLGSDWFATAVPRERFPDVHAWFSGWAAGDSEPPETFENPILTKSGEERLISWRNREVVLDGATHGLLAFGIDLTEQRKVEDQLRQSQKMEAVGQLTGGIAHDFNNLLTVISGYGELALADLAPDAPLRDHLEQITRAGERAARLTQQLLAFSRRQVLQLKPLNLNDVITDIEPMLTRLLEADITLTTNLDPELGITRADQGQIEQIIINLAINGRDAMRRGGQLLIETTNAELKHEFATTDIGADGGPYIMLRVTDNGEGMSQSTLDHVFEPFFTTKPPGEGTGLGLSTVYGIVKQTGGTIWADSKPERGTTFTVYLPRAEEGAELPATTQPTRAQTPRSDAPRSATILLVEDEETVRLFARRVLEANSHTVLAAGNAADAQQLAATHNGKIDLLLTDIVMPGLSGPDLAAQMLSHQPGLRILFTSGYTRHEITKHNDLPPGTAFLNKPFNTNTLARKVQELLEAPSMTAATACSPPATAKQALTPPIAKNHLNARRASVEL